MIIRITSIIILILVIFIQLGFTQESPEAIKAYRNDPYGDGKYRKKGVMDGNLFRTLYFNQAEVGKWPDQPSGEWPRGSGHSYLDGVCLLVGAKVAVNIAGIDERTPVLAKGIQEPKTGVAIVLAAKQV